MLSENTIDLTQESNGRERKCGFCNHTGHTVKTCYDSRISSCIRDFSSKIRKNDTEDQLVSWFMRIEPKLLNILCRRLLKIPYNQMKNNSEIENSLRAYIEKERNHLYHEYILNLIGLLDSLHRHTSIDYLRENPITTQSFIRFYNQYAQPATELEISNFEELLRIENFVEDGYRELSASNVREMRDNFLSSQWELGSLNRLFRFICHVCHLRTNYNYIQRYHFSMNNQVKYTHCKFSYNPNLSCPIDAEIDCAICMEKIERMNISKLQCGHSFCTSCIQTTIHKLPSNIRCNCPMCRTPIDTIMRMEK